MMVDQKPLPRRVAFGTGFFGTPTPPAENDENDVAGCVAGCVSVSLASVWYRCRALCFGFALQTT
jgi:hypothetical protein